LLVILLLVLANGFLAGAEIAIVAIRKTRLAELAERSAAARAVERLRGTPERFLATVQIGITVVGATAGAFGGARIADDLAPVLERVPFVAPWAWQLALAAVVALISYLSLVLGELVPKSLALRAPEGYALVAARPLLALSRLARPLVWFLTASSNAVLRIFGDRTTFTEARISPDELRELVGEATRGGTVDPRAAEIATRALEFGELTAADVMVPRNAVVGIPADAEMEEVRRLLLEHGHTRMPVYRGTLDDVVGYISAKDVLAVAWEAPLFVLADIVRPAYFVPETMKAGALLAELRQRRLQIAMVVDESGGLAGIVTLEDLLEEIVGEIVGESSRGPAEAAVQEPAGTYLVPGWMAIRDVNRELHLDLPESDESTTVAGLVLELAGRIPEPGERFPLPDGPTLEATDASPRQVRTVRIHPFHRDAARGGHGAEASRSHAR
jgi:putative hemolysin